MGQMYLTPFKSAAVPSSPATSQGVFFGGSTKLFNFSTEAVTTSAAALQSPGTFPGATSNATTAYAAGNSQGATGRTQTNKYTYSTDTMAAGTAIAPVSTNDNFAGAGNSTRGYFTDTPLSGSFGLIKYVYAGDVVSPISGLSTAIQEKPAAAGTTTKGYWAAGGTEISATTKVTYASDTGTSAGNLSSPRLLMSGISGSTFAIFAAGQNSSTSTLQAVTDKMTYATDATSAATSLTSARGGHGASADKDTFGIFAGGFDPTFTPINTITKYTFSNDVVVNSTSVLPAATFLDQSGASNVHGGL